MSYIRTYWETGDTITAEKLNNIETGVQDTANLSSIYPVHIVDSNTPGQHRLDHTWNEIKNAFKEGKLVYACYPFDDSSNSVSYAINMLDVMVDNGSGGNRYGVLFKNLSYYFYAGSPDSYPLEDMG